MNLFFKCFSFDSLTARQLYEILHLRQEVFVVEQNCAYLDADRKDFMAHHLLGFNPEGEVVAYARLLPMGVSYPKAASIGRVATKPSLRSKGLGKQLMTQAMRNAEQLYGDTPVTISAQSHLVKFYEAFGFKSTGKEYLEDDIPHTEMVFEG